MLAAGASLLAGCSLQPDQDHQDPHAPGIAPIGRPVRTAWVLGSGGPRGFAHIGALIALEELQLRPDLIVGSSAGALIGCLRAAGLSATTLQSLGLDFHGARLASLARLAIGSSERWSGSGVAAWLRAQLQSPLLEHLPVPMACVALRKSDSAVVAFTTGDAGLAVQASTAIEGQFAPVRIHGHQYFDADWYKPLPVSVARALGAQRVLAVDVSAHLEPTPAGAGKYSANDLRKRSLVEADERLADLVIHPQLGYWAGVSREYRERAIQAGRQATLGHAAALRALHSP